MDVIKGKYYKDNEWFEITHISSNTIDYVWDNGCPGRLGKEEIENVINNGGWRRIKSIEFNNLYEKLCCA